MKKYLQLNFKIKYLISLQLRNVSPFIVLLHTLHLIKYKIKPTEHFHRFVVYIHIYVTLHLLLIMQRTMISLLPAMSNQLGVSIRCKYLYFFIDYIYI